MSYKELGNAAFTQGLCYDAFAYYTLGLCEAFSQQGTDASLVSLLLNNRATTLVRLGSPSMAKSDALAALALSPHFVKPLLRLASLADSTSESVRILQHAERVCERPANEIPPGLPPPTSQDRADIARQLASHGQQRASPNPSDSNFAHLFLGSPRQLLAEETIFAPAARHHAAQQRLPPDAESSCAHLHPSVRPYWSKENGRYCVLNTAVPAGTTLLREVPYAHIIAEDEASTHCAECLQALPTISIAPTTGVKLAAMKEGKIRYFLPDFGRFLSTCSPTSAVAVPLRFCSFSCWLGHASRLAAIAAQPPHSSPHHPHPPASVSSLSSKARDYVRLVEDLFGSLAVSRSLADRHEPSASPPCLPCNSVEAAAKSNDSLLPEQRGGPLPPALVDLAHPYRTLFSLLPHYNCGDQVRLRQLADDASAQLEAHLHSGGVARVGEAVAAELCLPLVVTASGASGSTSQGPSSWFRAVVARHLYQCPINAVAPTAILPERPSSRCEAAPVSPRQRQASFLSTASSLGIVVDRSGHEEGDVRFRQHRMGLALYPLTASLINHSCDAPCVLAFEHGTQLVLRASRDMAAGETVAISYGPTIGRAPRAARQAELARQYCFDCRCSGCADEGRAWMDAAVSSALRCPRHKALTVGGLRAWALERIVGGKTPRDMNSALLGCGVVALTASDVSVPVGNCPLCQTAIPAPETQLLANKAQEARRLAAAAESPKLQRMPNQESVLRLWQSCLALRLECLHPLNKEVGETLDRLAFLFHKLGNDWEAFTHALISAALTAFRFGFGSPEYAHEVAKAAQLGFAALHQDTGPSRGPCLAALWVFTLIVVQGPPPLPGDLALSLCQGAASLLRVHWPRPTEGEPQGEMTEEQELLVELEQMVTILLDEKRQVMLAAKNSRAS